MDTSPLVVGMLLFDGFELLDAAGPIELLHHVDGLRVVTIAEHAGPIDSAQGVAMTAVLSAADVDSLDVVLVPGGPGTRTLVGDEHYLAHVRRVADVSTVVGSVCTGSALLAAAGLLDGYRATSNKKAFRWVAGRSNRVDWVPAARWVHDRDRWSSSGVAAGMDMAHALAVQLVGPDAARSVAERIEYEVHTDAGRDPFARVHGLA